MAIFAAIRAVSFPYLNGEKEQTYTEGEEEQTKESSNLTGYRLNLGSRSRSELTAVVSFVPCFYFLFLTVVGAVIIGLFNISERVRQHPSPEIESNVIATKKEPRLFMFAPKTRYGSPASKRANSAAVPTAKADAKKSKHHNSRAGSNGGY